MKKIIIIGICLVTGAIVYGFVDYLKTDKKQLQHMYGDEPAAPVAPPAAPAKTPAVAVAPPAKMSALNSLLKSAPPGPAKKKLKLELYSRAALEEKYITPDSTALIIPVIKKRDAPIVELRNIKQPKKMITTSVFDKVTVSSFSRAPLKKRPVAADSTAATAVPAN